MKILTALFAVALLAGCAHLAPFIQPDTIGHVAQVMPEQARQCP